MNARDKIKPKSIRVAILSALADGAITTIDDLQTTLDVPRKKVVDNAVHAANDNLIKRMRDDVTGLAAYQITATGREYLAKYSSGKEEEPSLPETPVCAESQTPVVTPGVKVVVRPLESIDDAHKKAVMAWETSMMAAVGEDGIGDVVKAIDKIKAERDCAWADYSRIRDLINANPEESTFDEVSRIFNELKTARAELELSRLAHKSEDPALYVLQRPAKPLTRFSKLVSAETRAMAFAKGGQRAQVFALTLVGTAVPGAEWRKA